MPVPKYLLEILACPRCKGSVKIQKMFVVCSACKLAYPVLEDSVPNMLIEDAWKVEKAKKYEFKHTLKL